MPAEEPDVTSRDPTLGVVRTRYLRDPGAACPKNVQGQYLTCPSEFVPLCLRCYPVAIRMIEQGLLPMDEIGEYRLPLSDFQKGIDLVISGLTSVKVTLEP